MTEDKVQREYAYVDGSIEELNRRAQLGWRIVPVTCTSPHLGSLLMERVFVNSRVVAP